MGAVSVLLFIVINVKRLTVFFSVMIIDFKSSREHCAEHAVANCSPTLGLELANRDLSLTHKIYTYTHTYT